MNLEVKVKVKVKVKVNIKVKVLIQVADKGNDYMFRLLRRGVSCIQGNRTGNTTKKHRPGNTDQETPTK